MSIPRKVAKAVFATCDLLVRPPKGPRLLIYHQIGAGLGRQMEVTQADFSAQLDWLAEHRRVVELETAVARWHEDDSHDLVVLTFDDGYRDTYTTAFPILKERGLPFTLYLSTEPIESGKSLGPSPEADPIGWHDVEAMLGSGLVTVGSHTHTHRDLRGVDEPVIVDELATSDHLIESRLGVTPRHFAYPWGYWDARAERLVKDRYATAVLGGSPRPDPAPVHHRLHRYPVQRDDGVFFFGARVRRGLGAEERLRRRLRAYAGP